MEVKLGEVIKIKHGFAFKGDYFTDEETGLAVLTPGNFTLAGGFQETAKYYNSTDFPEEYILTSGDLIVTMTDLSKEADTIGYAALVPENKNHKYLHNQRIGLVTVYNPDFEKEYIYWLMRSPNYQRTIANGSNGATVHHTSPDKIYKYRFKKKAKVIQKRIACILSRYDSLIENNNKRIKALEQMAEEIYKEWFVRFRFPGHETAEFENGIPKGWDIVRMNNFCYVTDGTHDTPAPTIDGVPLVTGKSLKEGFVDFSETYNISIKDHKQIKKRSGLKDGDILFSNIGTVGSTCVVDYDREFSVKNVIIFKLDSIEKTVYLYLWLNSKPMQDIFSMQTNGSSQQFVGLTFMRKYKVMVPQQNVLEKFCSLVNPIFEERKILHRENEYLMKQRDLLLPRLMSGKLEV